MKSYTPPCPSNYTPTVRLQAITACCRNASLFIRHRKKKKKTTHQNKNKWKSWITASYLPPPWTVKALKMKGEMHSRIEKKSTWLQHMSTKTWMTAENTQNHWSSLVMFVNQFNGGMFCDFACVSITVEIELVRPHGVNYAFNGLPRMVCGP